MRAEGEARPRLLGAVFFLSGAAALFYEVVFSKSLALTFGSAAVASTTVLATYMGGLALGAWLGARLAPRVSDAVRAYALCELGVGAFCALSPWLQRGLRLLYVALEAGTAPGRPAQVAVQVLLGALLLLPPTLLMGMTLPLLVREALERGAGLGESVAVLYGANTAGAALGSLLAGYAVLPVLGVFSTTLLAAALNLCAALLALQWRAGGTPGAAETPARAQAPGDVRARRAALTILAIGGAVTLALEQVDIHLLAVVAGNSAYAFSLMLFAFLAGLGLGAALGRGRASGGTVARDLALAQLALSAVLLGSVFCWAAVPSIFLSRAVAPLARGFAGRELVRFFSCALLMLPPALLIGFAYPLSMELVGRGAPERRVAALGRASALNTVGNVAGALLGGFVLIPVLGSLHALQALAATALLLSLLLLPRRFYPAGAAVLAAFALQPRQLDLRRLALGANVYFFASDRGPVIDHAESLDGGLTTVHAQAGVLTLNTNGKFQGSTGAEVPAQAAFAADSLLHTARRDHALVIGFGTGTTTHAIESAGFRQVDVAELSADILGLADRHFRAVNQGVLHSPRVRPLIADGRNALLLSRDLYDLISIEISSIWFAGAASLYNREFYALARARLAPGGVLQQWVQIHHLSLDDLLVILASARAELPHLWFYLTGGQGILIACPERCAPTRQSIAALRALGAHPEKLLQDRLLDPAAVDALLERTSPGISTDDNLWLEYSTPRGNALPEPANARRTLEALSRFAPASALQGTALTAADLAP